MMNDFVVSARKYRPATFRSVVGQEHITSTLRNAIERGQLAHAYLFCGPRGVGKTTCARIFAKAINCLRPEGAEACNACESCRSFNEGRSLNIHELDAASNNSVEDIRTLIEQVRILPQVGRYAVFIIDEVHMLSAAAFNAFLKTLEEPPAHAVFILATTEKHKIIPTILSRCQIYDFNRIRVEDAVGYLRHIASEQGIATDDESLNLIARKADGGMRDALSMFDKAVSFCGTALDYHAVAQTLNVLDYDTYFGIVDVLLGGDYLAALLAFDGVLARGFSGQTFLAGLNRHLRDLLVARNPATLPLLEVAGSLSERYREQAARCPTDFLFGAMALLTEADGRLRQSSNQRLLIELSLMKLAAGRHKENEPSAGASLPEPNGMADAIGPVAPIRPATAHPLTGQPAAPKPTPEHSVAGAQRQGVGTTSHDPSESESEGAHTEARIPTVKPGRIGPSLAEFREPTAQRAALQPPAETTPEATPPPSTTAPCAGNASARTNDQQATTPTAADCEALPTDAATGIDPVDATASAGELQSAARTGLTTGAEAERVDEEAPHTEDKQAANRGVPTEASSSASSSESRPAASMLPVTDPVAESVASRRNASHTPLVSGASITALMESSAVEPDEADQETSHCGETPQSDPESDRKLEASRERILALIRQKRPRFVAAFEQMAFRDGVISVTVPSAALREEILRSKTGMLARIAELAGIDGVIDLQITVNEAIRSARPIRLEDRMKYLLEKNPLLTDLRKALDLEAE